MPKTLETRKGYLLAGQSFKTKKEITEHFRRVRDRTELGEQINDEVVLELLAKHPEWLEKTENMLCVGAGLIKGHPSAPPSKQIAILNADSSITDISWSVLVKRLQKDGSLKAPTDFWEAVSELKIAARQDVSDQIRRVSKVGFHVDHAHPATFEVLLHRWVKSTGLSPLEIRVEANDGATIIRTIGTTELRESWQQFHEEHARLQLLTPEENLKRKKVKVDWEALR